MKLSRLAFKSCLISNSFYSIDILIAKTINELSLIYGILISIILF